jgi:hypothetical protein
MKPVLKRPGTKRLKLKHNRLLSSYAFNFNLRRYAKEIKTHVVQNLQTVVRQCRLSL